MTAPVAAYLDDLGKRYRAFGEGASEIPRLLAAVEAVLKHHEPVDDGRWHTIVCGRCRETWPCGEVQAISAALLGKEANHDRHRP